jgi:AcrR family transcriptional regulator
MYNKISYKTFHNEQTVLNILLEDFMDRRQKRTREAIFKAFTQLLSKYNYNQISVQQIIDTANIGRTTFYSHY